jgi:hypothetical protein
MKTLKLFAFSLIVCAFAPITKDKEIKLQYSFKTGDTFEWTQKTSQKVSQNIMGMAQDIETDLGGSLKLVVKQATATGAVVEMEYLKLFSKTSSPMGNVTMDSESTTDDVYSKVFKSMMGKKFLVTMSMNGNIEKVEGYEKIYSDFGSLGLDERTLATLKQSIEQSFGSTSMQRSLESALISYPDAKVKPGSTWTKTMGVAMNFPLQLETTFKFNGLVGDAANITAEGTITTTDKEKETTLPGGFKAKFNMSGVQLTTATANIKSGWANETKVSSKITGNMVLLAGGQIPQDMDVPMEIVTESEYTLVKK